MVSHRRISSDFLGGLYWGFYPYVMFNSVANNYPRIRSHLAVAYGRLGLWIISEILRDHDVAICNRLVDPLHYFCEFMSCRLLAVIISLLLTSSGLCVLQRFTFTARKSFSQRGLHVRKMSSIVENADNVIDGEKDSPISLSYLVCLRIEHALHFLKSLFDKWQCLEERFDIPQHSITHFNPPYLPR